MKNPLKGKKVLGSVRAGAFCLPVLLAGMPASGLAGQGTLGDLTAQGQIHVTGGVPAATITVANESYAYFSGDRVSTGQGSAILSVASVGKIGLDKDTTAKIGGSAQSLEVALEKGTVLYSVKPESRLQISAGGLIVTPTSPAVTKVAHKSAGADKSAVSGWVSVTNDGLVRVSSNTGQVRIYQSGETLSVVDAGKVGAFRHEGGQFVRVQAEAIQGGTATAAGISKTLVLGILGGVATVGAVVSVSGGGGDDEPASP